MRADFLGRLRHGDTVQPTVTGRTPLCEISNHALLGESTTIPMSDYRAIAGVSKTLRALLLDRMELPGGVSEVPVTIGPPPPTPKDANPPREAPRVNVFLYWVSENGNLINREIPRRGSPAAFGHPPLCLDLHYLITAYGNNKLQSQGDSPFDDTAAHLLLGSAVRVLHDVPVITESVVASRLPGGGPILHESLRDGCAILKITLEPLTLDDFSKLWMALGGGLRLSVAYVVNAVQVDDGCVNVSSPQDQPPE